MFQTLEWNRIFIHVLYDPLASPNYSVDLYTKNKVLATDKLRLGTSTTALLLTSIVFTNNDTTGKYPGISWEVGIIGI